MLTMQGALLALQNYWSDRGCLVMQPFNTEVGAGTYNPATVLRVLGPEPWRVGYVEPSVRPDDARYGENPNRLQTHTQFQVILKPDPGDPQEVYLGSLRALGVDLRAHDVRFVEDNWASPALGAWGLGWEVWLNGLEITQFTYFQQAGGRPLDPVSVEITYGVERIMMALQNVSHFKDIVYAPGISYGEVFGQAEYEMSRYYLDDADVETNRRLFDEYAAEARRCLDVRLPVPAHTFVLKCSHVFNVLDARGAISTTERARAFGRMRALAREVAALWTERRAELDHPLGVVAPVPAAQPVPAEAPTVPAVASDRPASFLLEIGTEELPAAEVTRGAAALGSALAERLAATRLAHGAVETWSTPRRIVARVADVASIEPDEERTVRGPRVSAAYDADGAPTRAVEGFARGQGVSVANLTRVDSGGVEHVAAVRVETGRAAPEVLADVVADVVGQLRAEENMRWRDPSLSYSRPIRWLVALYGSAVVPAAVGTLATGRQTRVHRTATPPTVDAPSADGYVELLAEHGVVADPARRRASIVAGAERLAAGVRGRVDVTAEAALVDEVTNLVESPNPLLGGFDQRYLELPEAVLTTVMRKHQRYLPVRDAAGRLLPHFVAVANGDCDVDVVRAGNEAVLRARYEDAAFFWRADLGVRPDDMKAGLGKLTFADGLGSMAERAERISSVAAGLADPVGLSADDRATLDRARALAKFDLAAQMVIELTSLAGLMAREYAVRAGEPAEVAQALYEMELPRSAGDSLPASAPGGVLALADRFDLLAGLFALGATPTGSSDPFGLRRAAGGLVTLLRERADLGLSGVTLSAGLDAAARALRTQGVEVPEERLAEARDFAVRRYEQQLLDSGVEHEPVRAVLPLADSPAAADAALAELAARRDDPEFWALAAALQRVRRILPADAGTGYDPEGLVEPAETALHAAVEEVRGRLDVLTGRPGPRAGGGAVLGLADFVVAATPLTTPINTFFDAVLVMADDPEVRRNRLGLLASVRELADPVLDWAALGSPSVAAA